MIKADARTTDPAKVVIATVAVVFFLVCSWTSYARWSNFQYRSFDLAYYVQAIWQLIHGRFDVSVENVPLLGNHVEPIVFLFAPLFVIFRHPILFVVVQNAALASMGPVGYDIAKRLGFGSRQACLLAAAILLAPAAGYIALHEFHPEAFTAPFLLLMLRARLTKSVGQHWLWFIAVLACKENMAPLLALYCATFCVIERKRGFAELRRWYVWPMAVALLWFVLCTRVITPALNSGNIDYVALYDRLGTSAGNILRNAIVRPQLIGQAIFESLTHGNLVWALLFPFLCLPLLRPRWILIAAPILLQHLLSWRSSEWMIYFHYGAPLLPLFWIASVEAIASFNRWKIPNFLSRDIPWLVAVACVVAEFWLGLFSGIVSRNADWFEGAQERARKNAFIAKIPSTSSVVAPLPYLSHLAMREKLYSLHYILKGLKTLSRSSYEPPPPADFVLIDYLDTATFDPGAGFYHPTMKTADGRIFPSSDRLLHDYLKRTAWGAESQNELTLLRNMGGAPPAANDAVPLKEDESIFTADNTELLSIGIDRGAIFSTRPLEIHLRWRFQGEREVFPWMVLRLSGAKKASLFVKGLCAPQVSGGIHDETWTVTNLPPGDYTLEALFLNNTKQAWSQALSNSRSSNLLASPVSLGNVKIER